MASSTELEPTAAVWRSSVPLVGSSFFSTPGSMNTDIRLVTPATSISPLLVQPHQETLQNTDPLFISNNHPAHNGNSQDPISNPIARNFLQDFEKAITERLGEKSNLRVPHYDSIQNDMNYPLPARQKADSLLTSYWNHVHILYPFLDKSQTEEDYGRFWNQGNSIPDKKSFLCLLNSIFAISSRHIRLADPNQEHLAATFCLRARELVDVESCSIRSVQLCLLPALCFQSINDHRMCWIFTRNAVRIAQILELHLVETSERESESRSKDLLRRVWHGCVLMDREVSMMYDRPCMIDVTTAAAVPIPLLEEGNSQFGNVKSPTNQAPQIRAAADFCSISLGGVQLVGWPGGRVTG